MEKLKIPYVIIVEGKYDKIKLVNIIDADIVSIDWKYSDVEGFKVNGKYKLNAEGVYPNNTKVGEGNNLIWSMKNKDQNDSEIHGEIIQEGNGYYLSTISEGEVVITCSNAKGNVSRSMNAIIYENGAILLTSEISSSQNNIDSKIYYGEYDSVNKMERFNIGLNIKTIPSGLESSLKILNQTDNIDVDIVSKTVKLKSGYNLTSNESASFTLGYEIADQALPVTFAFDIVKDGINVYNYEDLLACTNKSENGEIVGHQIIIEKNG